MIRIPEFFKNVGFFASRPTTPNRDELVYEFSQLGKEEVNVCTIPLGEGVRAYYVDKDGRKRIEEHLFAIANSSEKIEKHLQDYSKLAIALKKFEEKIKSLKINKKYLRECFFDYETRIKSMAEYCWMPFVIEDSLSEMFLKKLNEKYGKEAQEIYQAVNSITELYEYRKMKIKILEAAISKNKEKAIKELVSNYSWITEYSMIEKLADEDYFREEVKKVNSTEALDEINKIKEDIEESKNSFNKVRKMIKDPLLRSQADLINKYLFLRNDRVDIVRRYQCGLRKVFAAIAEIINKEKGYEWNQNHIAYFLNREIEDYLSKDILPDRKEIEKRMTGEYVYFYDKNGSHIITDNDFVKKSKEIIEKEVKIEEVKGTIAFKGKLSGRVAVVFSKSDLNKVTKGDILVARTTMPDYTPAMEIAAAFVTDEGGLLSHAAIISRELRKPCIVGTKIATKILKDGMLVEVDADKGIVKILDKNKK